MPLLLFGAKQTQAALKPTGRLCWEALQKTTATAPVRFTKVFTRIQVAQGYLCYHQCQGPQPVAYVFFWEALKTNHSQEVLREDPSPHIKHPQKPMGFVVENIHGREALCQTTIWVEMTSGMGSYYIMKNPMIFPSYPHESQDFLRGWKRIRKPPSEPGRLGGMRCADPCGSGAILQEGGGKASGVGRGERLAKEAVPEDHLGVSSSENGGIPTT